MQAGALAAGGPSALALQGQQPYVSSSPAPPAIAAPPAPARFGPPAAPPAMADIPPNQTIYVNNLPEKIKKHGAARSGAGARPAARSGPGSRCIR